ncbi:MAG: nucleotide exchange factor GrpE [Vulcanimicrobiaceae bacterium]
METDAERNFEPRLTADEPPDVREDAQLAQLSAELAAARERAADFESQLAYARADIENVRKRAQRIADDTVSRGRRSLLGKLLPVLDNLQRALGYEDSEALRNGLQATVRSFEELLAAEDVTPLATLGKPFDPRIADAIGTRISPDLGDDLVVEETQRGYRIGDEILRPAHVIVAKREPI